MKTLQIIGDIPGPSFPKGAMTDQHRSIGMAMVTITLAITMTGQEIVITMTQIPGKAVRTADSITRIIVRIKTMKENTITAAIINDGAIIIRTETDIAIVTGTTIIDLLACQKIMIGRYIQKNGA
jgi:hypothetical protein